MNALGQFIQQQMDARGWRQVDLVRQSGLTKQVVSHLLSDVELRRMIAPATITGLANAFGLDKLEIQLKAVEATGIAVEDTAVPIIRTAYGESSQTLLQILMERETVRHAHKTESAAAPNSESADSVAGGLDLFSGETPTIGDPRSPGLQSRRSDADDPETASPRGPVPRLAG